MPQQINEAQIDACILVSAILTDSAVQFIYTDRDGVLSSRIVRPSAIERCYNGDTIVRCFDTPRSFTYTRIAVSTVSKAA